MNYKDNMSELEKTASSSQLTPDLNEETKGDPQDHDLIKQILTQSEDYSKTISALS